jgi:predicted transcriptional regulator
MKTKKTEKRDSELLDLINSTGLSVKQFAKVCGIFHTTLYRAIKNDGSLSTRSRFKIRRSLGRPCYLIMEEAYTLLQKTNQEWMQ